MDVAAFVSSSLAAGDTPDEVARALIEDHHVLPISAIKALRSGSNMTLLEAKDVILRNLPPEKWTAAEKLWDEIVAPQDPSGGDG
jgi:hypothetical protein